MLAYQLGFMLNLIIKGELGRLSLDYQFNLSLINIIQFIFDLNHNSYFFMKPIARLAILLLFVACCTSLQTILQNLRNDGLTPRSLWSGNIDSKNVTIDYSSWVATGDVSISLLIYIEVGSGPQTYSFISLENEVDTHFNLIKPTSVNGYFNIYSESFTIAVTGSKRLTLSSPSKLGSTINTQLYFINAYKK